MEPVSGRQALAAWILLIAVGVAAIGGAAWLARDRLFGTGVTAIHDPAVAHMNIQVCGRSYKGDGVIRTMAAILTVDRVRPVLVEPAPLAPCPPPNEDGVKPCSNLALPTACATVVYVRVGEDAYAEYSLRGGP